MQHRVSSGTTGLVPLVLGERGCSVTFVLDTSERMTAVLGSVKRLLIRALQTKASTGDSRFNLTTFSHPVGRTLDEPQHLIIIV